MNIVELILKALSGDTLKQLSSLVGESPDGVQKALAAIVPTLLSGIGAAAAKPQGAEKLFNTLKHVNADDLGGILAGGAEEVQKKGTNILEDLLGKQSLAALIVPLAKFLAGNTALVTKLLPMVAPFVLSILSKQMKSGGLDAAGLLKMLLSQKGNIGAALPKGLAEGLAGVQGLGDLTSFATGATQAVKSAGTEAPSTNWLLPILAIAALLAAGWWFLNQKPPKAVLNTDQMKADAEKSMKKASESMQSMAESAAEDPVKALTKNFGGYFESVGGALDAITDEETAKAAVPKLEKMTGEFDAMSALFKKLPDAARGGFSTLLEGGQKTLTEKAEKVLGIAGVSDLLKPLLDGLLEKLAALLKG